LEGFLSAQRHGNKQGLTIVSGFETEQLLINFTGRKQAYLNAS